jgi:catechol 2,3-dioxygenase-like lactoylglutathione lyase family enzyme
MLDLLEWTDPPTSGAPYPHLAHAGIGRICLRVKGLDEMVAMLRAEGVVLVDEPTMPALNGANHKFVCFLDPDGSVIELMEFFK